MANKNIEIQYYNGSSYDALYPKTLGSLIEGNINATTLNGYSYSNIISGSLKLQFGSYIGNRSSDNETITVVCNSTPKILIIYCKYYGTIDSFSSECYYECFCFLTKNFSESFYYRYARGYNSSSLQLDDNVGKRMTLLPEFGSNGVIISANISHSVNIPVTSTNYINFKGLTYNFINLYL